MTTMSSTRSTVRSAVLNGVFSGTRRRPNRISVIFMRSRRESAWGSRRMPSVPGMPVVSWTDADDAGDAVDVAFAFVEHHRQQGRHRHAVERHPAQRAIGTEVGAAVGVVDDV